MEFIVNTTLERIHTKQQLIDTINNDLKLLNKELEQKELEGYGRLELSAFEEIISALKSIKDWAEGHNLIKLKAFYKEAIMGYMTFNW